MLRILKLTVINLAICLIFLIPADYLLGKLSVQNPAVDIETTKRLELRLHNPNIDIGRQGHEKRVRLRTDDDGMIIGPDTQQGNADIIFFGGSTTECIAADEDQRFPYLVGQQLFNRDANRMVRTLNAGRAGNHSLHSHMNLIGVGLVQQPEIVVLMHNINDLSLLTKTGEYWLAPESRRVLHSTTTVPPRYMSLGARLGQLFNDAGVMLYPNIIDSAAKYLKRMQRGNNTVDEWEGFRRSDMPATLPEMQQQFASSITNFVGTARAWNIEPVLMTQFNRIRLDDEVARYQYDQFVKLGIPYSEWVDMYASFNEVIREVAAENDVLLIDLANEIPPEDAYLLDAVHVTDEGSQLAAIAISKALAAHRADFELRSAEVNEL